MGLQARGQRTKTKASTRKGKKRRKKEKIMKVRESVKRIGENCKDVKRKRVVRVIGTNPRHKQRQGE